MESINTTLGKLNINKLGCVDVHEHIIIDGSGNDNIPKDFIHIESDQIAADLSAWKVAGGGSIVDSSPIGAGRNITLLEKTSQIANLPLIVSSGFHKLSYYAKDHWLFTKPEEKIYKILFEECTEGVLINDHHPDSSNRSDIKAGILKIGVDATGITPVISKILSAVGKAIDETGVNCMIHTEPGVPFKEIILNLNKNHIPPQKVIFCHMGKSLDPQLHQTLAKEGYYLEFDEMVRSNPPLPTLAHALLGLINKGYGGSILFAGDLARRSYWTCFGGKPGLQYLMTGLHDALISLGFTDQLLENIWVNNPQSFFCGKQSLAG